MSVLSRKYIFPMAPLLVFLVLVSQTVGYASEGQKELHVAVATNFIRAMDAIADSFKKKAGINLIRSTGATGMLYSQIVNGAPFDLFLAADEKRPELLYRQGLCEEPFTYAGGQVVLWSNRTDLDETENWQEVVGRNDIIKIAIANPETAPYGTAAVQAMEQAGIKEKADKQLVYGQNVGQAFQYGRQKAADLAFVAQSFALSEQGREGKTWLLPEAPLVIQNGCLLKDSPNRESVKSLIAFFQTPQAKTILAEFGYK